MPSTKCKQSINASIEEQLKKSKKEKKAKKEKGNNEASEKPRKIESTELVVKKAKKSKKEKIVEDVVHAPEEETIEQKKSKKSKEKRKLIAEIETGDNSEGVPSKKKKSNNEATQAEPVVEEIQCDLMLNVADIPVVKPLTKKEKEAKQKKFHQDKGKYVEKSIGLNGISNKTNRKVPEGVQLGFKSSNMHKTAVWNKKGDSAKKSYQHLINGDIIIAFKNCNLDEIKGYGL